MTIVHSRLLIGDFIPNDEEEKEIIHKLNSWGFIEVQHNDNIQIQFSTNDMGSFLTKLKLVCNYNADLLDYINNMFFWIFKDDILPRRVIVIEVALNDKKLQGLNKNKLESELSRFPDYLGRCFNADSTIYRNSSDNLNILNFSYKAIHNITIRNFVAEFYINDEPKIINDLNSKLCQLETSTKAKFFGEGRNPRKEMIKDVKDKIISIDPLSSYRSGFYRSIVYGYGNEMFIIGKIGQGTLKDSAPLYLSIIREEPATPISLLEDMPVLQPPQYPFLDFSSGAGQILLLQLLNSWNRYLDKSINNITINHSSLKKDNKNFNNEIKELHDLISYRDTNEKITTNFRGNLQNLITPTTNTPLHEVSITLEKDSPLLITPEKYGLEKPGAIVSNLSSLIFHYLDLNENGLLGAIDLRMSEIELLKIEEDHKYSEKMVKNSKIMLCLTVVIAIATIVNVILFVLRG
jgi:hypothetical protein